MDQTIVFAIEFAKRVKSGKKRQTIRRSDGERKNLYVGDKIRLDTAKGNSYVNLGVGIVKYTRNILWNGKSFENHHPISDNKCLAYLDGFSGVRKMNEYFKEHYPEPTEMIIIRWELEPETGKGEG